MPCTQSEAQIGSSPSIIHILKICIVPRGLGNHTRFGSQQASQDTNPCFCMPSLSLLITVPRVIRLLLICVPSFNRAPSAPLLATRSEPAKSTRFCSHSNRLYEKLLGQFWGATKSILQSRTFHHNRPVPKWVFTRRFKLRQPIDTRPYQNWNPDSITDLHRIVATRVILTPVPALNHLQKVMFETALVTQPTNLTRLMYQV
jgi:hypothetical protein